MVAADAARPARAGRRVRRGRRRGTSTSARSGSRRSPTGSNRYNGFWSHTLLGGYGFADGEHAKLGYLLSALIGIAVIALALVIAVVVQRSGARGSSDGSRRRRDERAGDDAPTATATPTRPRPLVRFRPMTGPLQPLVPRPPPGTEAPSDRATPQWLLQGELAMCPCGCIGKRKKGSLRREDADRRRRTCCGRSMFGEDVAAQRGLLQRVDPRVKLVGLLGLLVVAGARAPHRVLVGDVRGDAACSPRRRRCRSASSSSGCGCSCRSSPASWCCRRRCRS